MTAITAVLARFPEAVMTAVTHPVTGLPAKKSWLPTIREVRDACDEIAEPIKQNELREARIAEQLARRAEDDAMPRPTYDQLKAKYGPEWGFAGPEGRADKPSFKAPTPDELAAHYREHDLAFKPRKQAAE